MSRRRAEEALHLITDPRVSARSLNEDKGRGILESLNQFSVGDKSSIPETLHALGGICRFSSSLFDSKYYNQSNPPGQKYYRTSRGQGWSRPGPGRSIGSGRTPQEDGLCTAFSVYVCGALFSMMNAVKNAEMGSVLQPIQPKFDDIDVAIRAISNWKNSLPNFTDQKKSMWCLSSLLHTPGVLCKVTGSTKAVAVSSTACSSCKIAGQAESKMPSCRHVAMFRNAMGEVSKRAPLSQGLVYDVLEKYYEVIHREKSYDVMVCADNNGPVFSVVAHYKRTITNESLQKVTTLTVVRRAERSLIWFCLSSSYVTGGSFATCSHALVVTNLVSKSKNDALHKCSTYRVSLGLEEKRPMANEEEDADNKDETSALTHFEIGSFHIVPNKFAFNLDLKMTAAFYKGDVPVLECKPYCDCQDIQAGSASKSSLTMTSVETNVLVECDCIAITCKLYEKFCLRCEMISGRRRENDGLVWISKYTAYTEVSLFRALHQIVFGGTSIGVIEEAREELMILAGVNVYRGTKSFRNALNQYAKNVHIPSWLFRCLLCSDIQNGNCRYRHLSFDGLQVGYRKSKSTGPAPIHDVQPVFRNEKAAGAAYIVQRRKLRSIFFEALRARPIPLEVNSLSSLCSKVFTLRINNQEMVAEIVSSLKIFDPKGWLDAEHHCETSFSNDIRYINDSVEIVFTKVLDCTRVARVLAVVLQDLSSDLLKKIDPYDKEVLVVYSNESRCKLEGLISTLRAPKRSRGSVQKHTRSSTTFDGDYLCTTNGLQGISEHVKLLHGNCTAKENNNGYLYRWSNAVISQIEQTSFKVTAETVSRFQAKVKDTGDLTPGYDNTVKILMLITAVMKEPCCVWMRSGSFDAFSEITNALLEESTLSDVSNLMNVIQTYPGKTLPVLCEGAIATAWSIECGKIDIIQAVGNLLRCVPRQHDAYLFEMVDRSCSMPIRKGYITPIQYEQQHFCDQSFEPQGDTVTNDNARAIWDGDVFGPDFPRIRPAPMKNFNESKGVNDIDHSEICAKVYPGKKDITPGTFIATCTCKHAKCVAVINLRKPEGSRVPVNFVLARCKDLPEIVVYDFACGSQSNALGISAHLVEKTRFVVDRFHFNSHKTCSLAMHPDSHLEMKGKNTSSQEQRNSSVRPLQHSLREMTEDNFKNFVVLAHALLNAKAMYRDHLDSSSRNGSGVGMVTSQTRGWISWIRDEIDFRRKES